MHNAQCTMHNAQCTMHIRDARSVSRPGPTTGSETRPDGAVHRTQHTKHDTQHTAYLQDGIGTKRIVAVVLWGQRADDALEPIPVDVHQRQGDGRDAEQPTAQGRKTVEDRVRRVRVKQVCLAQRKNALCLVFRHGHAEIAECIQLLRGQTLVVGGVIRCFLEGGGWPAGVAAGRAPRALLLRHQWVHRLGRGGKRCRRDRHCFNTA